VGIGDVAAQYSESDLDEAVGGEPSRFLSLFGLTNLLRPGFSRSKVDDFVAKTRHVDLKMVGEAAGGEGEAVATYIYIL